MNSLISLEFFLFFFTNFLYYLFVLLESPRLIISKKPATNTVIYYSNGYDLEKRLQSEDRAHRIGQTKSVTYVDIICEDTVDEKITKALRKKINIASEVLGEDLKDWI